MAAGLPLLEVGSLSLDSQDPLFDGRQQRRADSPNTRRAYAGVLDRLAAELGPGRQLAAVPGDEIAAALRRLWDSCAPATWNRNRAAIVSWLTWCAQKKRWPAPQLPPDAAIHSGPCHQPQGS